MNEHQRELLIQLAATECRCGQSKAKAQSFCRSCYFSLPQAMRQSLYKRIGQGYEEAHAAAVKSLDGKP